MESRAAKDLNPILAQAFFFALEKWKVIYPNLPTPFLTCTHRGNDEQNKLYAQGRTIQGKKVTNARAGQSPHNYLPSYAFDVAFKKPDGSIDWNSQLFYKFAALLSNNQKIEWGGIWKFTDLPHFELKNWETLIK